MQFFEVTESQKKLARVGDAMMNYSENYGKEFGLKDVTDDGLRTLNHMSEVGYNLTLFGAPYNGTKASDFSDADRKLIVDFCNNSVDIERK